jgi:hypothetical protein
MKSSPERLSLGSLVGYLYIGSCDPHCCLCQGDLFGSVTSSGSWNGDGFLEADIVLCFVI